MHSSSLPLLIPQRRGRMAGKRQGTHLRALSVFADIARTPSSLIFRQLEIMLSFS
jgi:hypothetical protein